MNEDVSDRDAAITLAERYADDDCIGQFDKVTEVEERELKWLIEFQTHTFSDTYTHRVRITKSVGNVISHDRSSRFE